MGSGAACPVAFCPGDEVTYTCDVGTAYGSTVWSFPEGTCNEKNNEVVLLQSSFAECASGVYTCGGFSARNIDLGEGQHCTVSKLMVDLNKAASETAVKCLNIQTNGSFNEVGKADITKAGNL